MNNSDSELRPTHQVGQQFDALSASYVDLISQQHQFFGRDVSYIQSYKVALAKQLIPDASTILDYGCGVGLLQKFIPEFFPNATITAADLSPQSLEIVHSFYPDVQLLNCEEALNSAYDLILVSCVMHHVHACEQQLLVDNLLRALSPGGAVLFFEHNPWNPITRHLVNTCPIDTGVILLRRSYLKKLLKNSGFEISLKSGYTLFFPEFLASLRPMEQLICSFPLGGQYFVLATRT